ncbi:MAG: retropepsin-like aspartic protease/reverse transcriptase, partial [Cyanobacteria bacterium J06553_1]
MACVDEDIPEEEMVSVMKRFLTDDAHFWFYVESGLLDQRNTTFTDFAVGLKERFLPEHHGADLWRQLSRLQQGRTNIRDFNGQFRKLAKQVQDNLSIDELIAHMYLEQLDPKLQMWVRTEWKKDTTLQELMHQAERQTTTTGADTTYITQRSRETTETTLRPRNQWHTTTTPKKCPIHPEGRHTEEQCMVLRGRRRDTGKKATLNQVGQPNHGSSLLTIPLLIKGEEIRALIDSGATENYLSTDLATTFDLPINRAEGIKRIRFANGDEAEADGSAYAVSTGLRTRRGVYTANTDFLVTTLQSYKIILGRPWLDKHNPVINWKHNTVDLPHRNGGRVLMRRSRQPIITPIHPHEVNDDDDVHHLLQVRRIAADPESATDPYTTGDVTIKGADKFIAEIKTTYREVFVETLPDLPPQRAVAVEIDTQDAKPVFKTPYRLTNREQQEMEKQLTELLRIGIIRPSLSEWGAPVLFAAKKDGTLRMCVDYRGINALTQKIRYPLPRIEELFDVLGRAKIFSRLDLKSGYHQLRMHPDAIHKTAFVTRFGQFEYVTAPFGLTNLPSYFQKLMQTTFRNEFFKFVIIYLDDIVIFSNSVEEHAHHLEIVLTRLRNEK